jgi:hypothetical protein
MPFRIEGGDNMGSLLAAFGGQRMRDPSEVEAEQVRLRTAQQEAALFPLKKQVAELGLKEAQFKQAEQEYTVKERGAWQEIMGKYGGDYDKARPELSTKLRPATLGTVDKLYLEYGDKVADIGRKRAETVKITQETNLKERDTFGDIGVYIRGANYDPTALEALLTHAERTNPYASKRIADIRTEAAKGPDAIKQLVDAMITPDAEQRAADVAAKRAAAAKTTQEVALGQMQIAGRTVPDNPEDWKVWYANLTPEMKRQVPATYSLAAADKVRRMGMTEAERETARHNLATEQGADLTRQQTLEHQLATEALTTRGQDITRAGQLLTDARQRELAELTREAQKLERENRPPSQAQHTVATYAARMDQAEKTFQAIPQIGRWGASSLVPDWAKSTEAQQFDQATRNFINSVLRRESGAVISDAEFENALQQYIPQPSDTKEKLALKAENRAIVRQSFISAAGKAYETPEALLQKSKAGGGLVIEVNGKRYKYKGTGDTAKLENYTEVPR